MLLRKNFEIWNVILDSGHAIFQVFRVHIRQCKHQPKKERGINQTHRTPLDPPQTSFAWNQGKDAHEHTPAEQRRCYSQPSHLPQMSPLVACPWIAVLRSIWRGKWSRRQAWGEIGHVVQLQHAQHVTCCTFNQKHYCYQDNSGKLAIKYEH